MPRGNRFKYQASALIGQPQAALTTTIGGILAAGSLQAATITVTTLDDGFIDGQCTLRSAIAAANSNLPVQACAAGSGAVVDRIEFQPGLSGTINLEAGVPVQNFWDGSQLRITESVDIVGRRNGIDVNEVSLAGTGAAPVFYIQPGTDRVSLENLTVTGGFSPEDLPDRPGFGGGVLSYGRALTLDGMVFTANGAVRGGGAVWHQPPADDGVLIASDCLFALNTTQPGQLGEGGGLAVQDSVVSISNCIFSNNEGDGDGAGASLREAALIGVVDSYFFGNVSAAGRGGGLAIESSTAQLYLAGNVFENNEAGLLGGALSVQQPTIASPDPVDLQLVYNRLDNNRSAGDGGGLAIQAGPGDVLIETLILSNNRAEGSGGAARFALDGTRLDWQGGGMANNLAYGYGGGGGLAIQATDAQLDFNRLALFSNFADTGCGGAISISPLTGFNGPDSVVLEESVLFNNTGDCGGALDLFMPNSEAAQILLDRVEFSENEARGLRLNGFGGAAYFNAGPSSLMVISNSTISGNEAALSGAGLHARNGARLSVKYSTFANNTAGYAHDIMSNGEDCTVRNTILAGTLGWALDGTSPCSLNHSLIQQTNSASFTFGENVLRNVDPLLGPLADNGNVSWALTHAPAPDSPVIDAGSASISAPPFDQRGEGFARILGPAIDLGALESEPAPTDRIFSDRFGGSN